MNAAENNTSQDITRLKHTVRALWDSVDGAVRDETAGWIACLAKEACYHVANEVRELFQSHGLDCDRILARVPDGTAAGSEPLPEVYFAEESPILNVTGVKDLLQGKGDALAVLRAQLSRISAETRQILEFPYRLSQPAEEAIPPLEDASSILTISAAQSAIALALGETYFAPNNDGLSDFLGKTKDPEFKKAVTKLYQRRKQACRQLYASDVYWSSPLGAVHKSLGESSARVLSVATAAELELIDSAGPLTFKRLVLAYDPKRYCSNLKPISDTVKSLIEDDKLQLARGGSLRPWSHILLSDDWYDDITDWLHTAEPISKEDLAEFDEVAIGP